MTAPLTYRQAMLHAARRYWVKMLVVCGGSVSLAAKQAGVNRTDAYRQFQRLGIVLPMRRTRQLYGRRGLYLDQEQHAG